MTSRHRPGLAVLALTALAAVPAGTGAQTVEEAPTNCCAEIYQAGWELGRLRSIASYPTADYRRDAGAHMDRLSTTLQAANETCCRFCEAWVDWAQIQSRIRATVETLLEPARSDAVEARQAFHEWLESHRVELIEGLNRCDLEDGMPCKWLGLVECARAYFQLGVQLGHAMHALSVTGGDAEAGPGQAGDARQDGVDSLEEAVRLITDLRADGPAAASSEPQLRCSYLWETETGAARLLSEVLGEPHLYTGAQLTARASEAHRLVLRLLVEGHPDLGISPCPIGAEHDHAKCEFAEEHGHPVPAGEGN